LNELAGMIQIDLRSSEPIYLQIARQIEQLVAAGSLRQGDQLPTVRELATELRINFNTVARAYRLLDEERLISTQRGRGTYIWEMPDAGAQERLIQHGLEDAARRYLSAALRLGCTPAQAAAALEHVIAAGLPADSPAETDEPQ